MAPVVLPPATDRESLRLIESPAIALLLYVSCGTAASFESAACKIISIRFALQSHSIEVQANTANNRHQATSSFQSRREKKPCYNS